MYENRNSFKLRLLKKEFINLTLKCQEFHNDRKNDVFSVGKAIGALQCASIAINAEMENLLEHEKTLDDHNYGKSFEFNSRGIGLDRCPCCFVCGATSLRDDLLNSYLHNISGFVKSKDCGESIVKLFKQGVWLDYREREPNWIQVKIGACDKHLPNLTKLNELVSHYSIIRKSMIDHCLETM